VALALVGMVAFVQNQVTRHSGAEFPTAMVMVRLVRDTIILLGRTVSFERRH
jgi:hypothetical protein